MPTSPFLFLSNMAARTGCWIQQRGTATRAVGDPHRVAPGRMRPRYAGCRRGGPFSTVWARGFLRRGPQEELDTCHVGRERDPPVGCQAVGMGRLGQPHGEHGSLQPMRRLPSSGKMRWVQLGGSATGGMLAPHSLPGVGGSRSSALPLRKRRGDSDRGGSLGTESYIGAGRWSCCAGASRRPGLPSTSRRGWEPYSGATAAHGTCPGRPLGTSSAGYRARRLGAGGACRRAGSQKKIRPLFSP